MGILSTLSDLCFGRQAVAQDSRGRGRPGSPGLPGSPGVARSRQPSAGRRCQIESLEPRRLLAGDGLAPNVLLGSVYFEEATGDDSQPDVIQVSFVGGAPGTTLDRLVINGDKKNDGLTEGDVFFDTAAGGLGAFEHVGLSIVSASGLAVDSVSVTDGGSQIIFTFSGFEAGEKLVFSVDADEAQFIEAGALDDGQLDASEVDVNPLVEGSEFQRSAMVGEFSAAGYVDLTLSGTYWDEFDDQFAAAETTTGQTLGLPHDEYTTEHNFKDRTAGAVAHAAQIPLATLSGWVYHDRSDDGTFDRGPEEGIGGVTLALLSDGGIPTGITTTTSTNPATLGYYEFRDLLPGTYGVLEVQPGGWLDGKDAAGSHGGAAADESAGPVDRITGAVLDYGDDAVEYDFGELLPGSIRGRIHADDGPDCDFDNPDTLLEAVRVDLLDGQGNLVDFRYTDENGEYAFTGLYPAIYQVREHQPQEYYDGGERVGSAGGESFDVGNTYSIIAAIPITSGLDAVEYDFCEKVGATLSGWVYHDRSNEGTFDRGTEEGIGGVTVELLNADGSPTGITTTTSTDPATLGFYQFTHLAAGTYGVREVQPDGWLDGIDTPGSHGGTAAEESAGRVDRITGAVLTYGDEAVEYAFGELLPSSIAGRVGATTGPRCEFDNPPILLEGVEIDLLDAEGTVLDTTYTDASGQYHFDGLAPGEYQVFEHQPAGYYDGGERVGTAGGQRDRVDTIYSIVLVSDTHGRQYDFCEHVGVMLSGYVYHDRTGDGIFDRGDNPETGIGGVVLKLLDGDGQDTGLRATTDPAGFYKFNDLAAGKYAVMEMHPDGWLDGIDTPGNLGGVADASPPGDMISQIMINFGQMGVEYNFGELLPGSIQGRVYVCPDPDTPIPGVTVDLLDGQGQVIDSTTTDADGAYSFTDLYPGQYSVREHQPEDYFDNKAHLGSGGGSILDSNNMTDIDVGSGQDLVHYDFCELPPSELSGYVFIDGAPIVTNDLLTPGQVAALRDGQHTPDDRPLAGVVLELRNGVSGDPIRVGEALPGYYPDAPDDPIHTVTDADGFYHFGGLPGGTYGVVEVTPAGLVDGLDTPGTLGGYAINPEPPSGDVAAASTLLPPGVQGTLELFQQEVGNDAIVWIPLAAGEHSERNNFSEVQTEPFRIPPPPLPPEPPPEPPVLFPPPLPPMSMLFFPLLPPPVTPPAGFGGSSGVVGYTWHLSVVNAGQPRSTRLASSPFQFTASQFDVSAWHDVPMDQGHWILAKLDGDQAVVLREELFGGADAVPVAGDFNGDGVSEMAVFVAGHWLVDVNGNGRWDDGDLWAQLGTGEDLPITGDWDADGKTDIGIYGPAWPRDPWAIANEPGLPDLDNFPTLPIDKMKNVPPLPDEATSGARVLKLTAHGQPRADLIDHVFHYGTPGDVPITGDWNGDGIRSIGVYRDGQWNLDLDGDGRFTDADASFAFGELGDLPVVGDFDGDGVDEIGVYRAGQWVLDINHNHQPDAHDKVFELGGAGDRPVVGDWNGDGTDDPGTFHPEQAHDRVSRHAG